MQTIFSYYSPKDREKSCSIVIKTQNNARFYFLITHSYINIIDYHYYLGMHSRKTKQRVASHLNTNSRLLKIRNIKTQIQVRYTKYIITDTKF